uniref:LRAT domain-containing protein n=1 Tax=Picea sitchensis TaxID=3332 RepID=B8LN59_PICSI|nr:unknown [Picea sitchensis]
MGILFNEVDRSDLRAGDHVYSWRTGYTYAHHGIFVGDNDVVHFTRGSGQELEAGASLINSFASSSIPKQHLSCPRYPDSCGFQHGNSGVIRSCLDCFLEGGPVYRFEYGVSKAVFLAQVRGGTCTLAQSDIPGTVINRAIYLHKNGFGNYDLFSNNCEDFAIYCKTGFIVNRNASGRSGQVAAVNGVCSASRFAFDHRDMLNNSLGLALILAGTFFYNRFKADIGVRVDKTKVPVEDLAVYFDSSTRIRVDKTKIPVEDPAVYPDSSTGIRVDKTKVRVEDVTVFLESFTGKKPPVQDSAVYLDSSTGIGVEKNKLAVAEGAVFLDSSTRKNPVQDLAVYADSSTGIGVGKTKLPVEDVVVFPDSSTGKKPPVAESSTSQAICKNRRSKKKKKKLRQQQKRNCDGQTN